MNLPSSFAHEADAHEQGVDSPHFAMLARHVGERFSVQFATRQLSENVAGLRPRQIQGRQAAGQVSDVNVPARTDQPPLQPLLDKFQVSRSGGNEVMVISQPGHSPIIEHDPGFVAKDGIAHAPRAKI